MKNRAFKSFGALLLIAFSLIAHRAQAAPTLTVDQIMSKYIAATGGADAYDKVTSSVAKATISLMPQGITGTLTVTQKAPSKFLAVTNLAGVGDSKQGYDGTTGWSQDVLTGLRTLSGTELADLQRQADFNSPMHWKTLYPTAESLGIKKVGEVDAYAVKLTPTLGASVTQYFDAKTFLLLEEDSMQEGPMGNVPVISTFSDYRAVDGVKTPFTMVQKIAGIASATTTLTDVKNNVPVDDKLFAKPSDASTPATPPVVTPGDATKV